MTRLRSSRRIRKTASAAPRNRPYVTPAERSLDVDTPFDLKIASYLLASAAGPD